MSQTPHVPMGGVRICVETYTYVWTLRQENGSYEVNTLFDPNREGCPPGGGRDPKGVSFALCQVFE